MKTRFLIIVAILIIVGIFAGFYFANMTKNIENEKAMEEWRELRVFVMNDLGKQKKCEEMGGLWNTDHCLITQETFDSNKLTCEPRPVLEDATCQSNGIKLVFEPTVESKKTSGIFYPRIHISIFPATESTQYVEPDFVTICPGSQITWSNYDDVPVSLNSVDPDNAWSTTVIPPDGHDTVTFEETGIFEYKGNEGIHGFIIVMDDAHRCLDIIKDSFSIKIKKKIEHNINPVYQKLWNLFESALMKQEEGKINEISM